MKIIQKDEFPAFKVEILATIKSGGIIIYPTDTIYGIGCDATNEEAVQLIRSMKGRSEAKPLSIVAPSKDWVLKHCDVVDRNALDRLPGPYTLIFNLKKKNCVAKSVNYSLDTLGIRIPDHWFSQVVSEAGIPVVTTSVNISGTKHMETIEELPEKFKNKVAFLIYEGEKKGVRSKLIDLTN